jgi:hypothetical protein
VLGVTTVRLGDGNKCQTVSVGSMSNGYPNNWDRIRKSVYRRDGFQCQSCGRKGGPVGNAELHAHHRVPKSKGGSHHPNNLVTVCKSCHESIHGHPIPTGGGRRSGRKSSSSTSSGPPGFDPESMDEGMQQLRDIYMGASEESQRTESVTRGASSDDTSSTGYSPTSRSSKGLDLETGFGLYYRFPAVCFTPI